MTKRWLALLVACLALPVAAGCGGSDSSSGSSNGNSGGNGGGGGGGTTAPAQPAPAAKGGSADVTMKDIKFNPSKITIKKGQTVVWTNDDPVGHDVTDDGFKSGSPGGIENGQTFQHKFPKKGTFKYQCSVHPGMTGEVVVK
jgi:plastocyanin